MRKSKMNKAFVMSIAMSLSLLAGYGSAALGEATTAALADDGSAVYGIVTEIDDDSITIKEVDEDSMPGKGGPNGRDQQDQDSQPPEKPDGSDQQDQNSQPPEKPDGSDQQDQNSQPPEKPDGQDQSGNDKQGGQPPEMNYTGEEKTVTITDQTEVKTEQRGGHGQDNDQNGKASEKSDGSDQQNEEVSLSDIKEGDMVAVELDEDGSADEITVYGGGMKMPGGQMPGGPGGQSSQPESYDALNSFTENTTVSGETYKSEGTDENAVLVKNGAGVTLDQVTVSRTSENSTGGDSSSFYGVGAAILNTEGNLTVKNSTISTDAAGGAGIYSYGDKAKTYVTDTTIATKKDTSGGLHVAGGGTLYAWNVNATTEGQSSAAIRSDRGGGTMVIDGGTFTSNGTGSPAVYTTADISVANADLTATNSEAVCIEGKNTLRLYDVDLSGNMPENEQNDCTWNVILYQSMSGDSEEGTSTFDMQGGTLTAKNGGMFYTTNTESSFILNNVNIKYADQNDFFLKCTGNSNKRGWGSAGQNGAKSTFTGISQKMEGDVIWDSISTLDLYLTEGSTLTGAVLDDESNAGSGGDSGYCNMTISKDSSWIVTGDSSLTTLSSEGKILDEKGNTVTIKGTDGTVYVKGDSQYTITVNEYKEKADLTKAGQSSDQSKHTVQRIDEDTVSE